MLTGKKALDRAFINIVENLNKWYQAELRTLEELGEDDITVDEYHEMYLSQV